MKALVALFSIFSALSGSSLNAFAGDANVDSILVSTATTGTSIVAITTSVVVPGSNVTLQGPTGYTIGQSSVIASSFWGNGSNLTGIINDVILSATQTFTGAQTFASSVTIRTSGREIVFSTSNSNSNIRVSTAGVAYFDPTLHNSSSTQLPEYQTSNTTFGPCVPGSTLTIVTAGGKVEANFSAVFEMTLSTAITPILNLLVDSQFVAGMSSTKGLVTGGLNDGPQTISFSFLLENLQAGTHSFCLTAAAPPWSFPSLQIYNGIARTATNIFFVKEIR